jgi:TRAP-type C4-dicarboxylate transport system permease small subunit
MPRLTRIMRLVDALRDHVCGALLIAIFALINLQVFFRYVVNDPLSWPEEIARLLFVWAAYLGVAKLFRERLHYAIAFFIELAPLRVQALAGLAVDLLTAAAFVTILLGAGPVLNANAHIRTAIGVPLNWLYASLPAATILILPAVAFSLVDHIRRLRALAVAPRSMPDGGAAL